MSRIFALLYGIASYAVGFATLLYAIGFTTSLVVPKAIDDGVGGPLGVSIVVDCLLV